MTRVVRAAGARAVRVAADDVAGHGPPLPVPRLRARVAARHQPRRPSRGRSCPRLRCGGRWTAWCASTSPWPGSRKALAVAWNTANDAVLAEGARVLIGDPSRFDGVTVLGVDEHVWRHTRRGDKYVTVIIDLTADPRRDRARPGCWTWSKAAPSRRSKPGSANARSPGAIGCRSSRWTASPGSKPLPAEEMPDAVAVMDPFHVVRLAGDALDRCRRRVQQSLHGHRGRTEDPLYRARRTLHTGADLLTNKQKHRLTALFADDGHVEVEATWGVYQQLIAAYRHPDRDQGRASCMTTLIGHLRPRRPHRTERGRHPRPDPEQAGRRRARLLRPPRHQQRAHGSHQRPTRAPPRLRPRVPQPHQLHRPITARDRRLQTPTTPPIVKSRHSQRCRGAGPPAAATAQARRRPRAASGRRVAPPVVGPWAGSSRSRPY